VTSYISVRRAGPHRSRQLPRRSSAVVLGARLPCRRSVAGRPSAETPSPRHGSRRYPIGFARSQRPRNPARTARAPLSRPGRRPLYVRAQPDSAGLTGTQRTTTARSTTARANAYAQATGRFRWWWQVLGSNQRRLSRRFYRPLHEPFRAWPTGRPWKHPRRAARPGLIAAGPAATPNQHRTVARADCLSTMGGCQHHPV